jgi:hypothetical protein
MLCYDQPNNPMTFPAAVPEIPAANIDKAAAYYVNTLGFTFDWGDEQARSDREVCGNVKMYGPLQDCKGRYSAFDGDLFSWP